MKKTVLNNFISVSKFKKAYWLKSELRKFAIENGINSSGGKLEIQKRIEDFLRFGKKSSSVKKTSVHHYSMPEVLKRSSVINPAFTLGKKMRDFLEREVGRKVTFNQTLRDYIKYQHGKTLDDAIVAWQKSLTKSRPKIISKQFEYNNHIRDYFIKNPKGSLKNAIADWNDKKSKRNQ